MFPNRCIRHVEHLHERKDTQVEGRSVTRERLLDGTAPGNLTKCRGAPSIRFIFLSMTVGAHLFGLTTGPHATYTRSFLRLEVAEIGMSQFVRDKELESHS